MATTNQTDHGQGEVKHPDTDKRLKENGGGNSQTTQKAGEHDRRHDDNGQGQVKDPATDGRLKENRDGGSTAKAAGDDDVESGGQGRVKDPAHDGRLKEHR